MSFWLILWHWNHIKDQLIDKNFPLAPSTKTFLAPSISAELLNYILELCAAIYQTKVLVSIKIAKAALPCSGRYFGLCNDEGFFNRCYVAKQGNKILAMNARELSMNLRTSCNDSFVLD